MTGRNSSYKGDTYDGSFKLKIENFFEVPERIVVKSEEFEFCGYIFQAKTIFNMWCIWNLNIYSASYISYKFSWKFHPEEPTRILIT